MVAQVIDHLQLSGDQRHDIVYVCSNGAIARQNLSKLVPDGIEPLDDVERLTMLSLAELDHGTSESSGVNLLAITPGTSLKFGHSTGRFPERCLAYAYLRATGVRSLWSLEPGESSGRGWIRRWDNRLRDHERRYRPKIQRSLADFARELEDTDRLRRARNHPTLRELFDHLVAGLKHGRRSPPSLRTSGGLEAS